MTAETPKIIRHKRKPLTQAQIARLKAVADLPDGQIDFSDIPEADDVFFENALRGDIYRPAKRQITLRLDAPIIEWFKRKWPRGYQTEINRALREMILDHQRNARQPANEADVKRKG